MPKNQWLWLSIALTYTLALLYFSLSNTSLRLPDDDFPHKDKLLHFIAYIVLAIVWGIFFLNTQSYKPVIASFAVTLIIGILLETVQEWINPIRTFDWLDMLANILGVITGTIIVHFFLKSKVKLI